LSAGLSNNFRAISHTGGTGCGERTHKLLRERHKYTDRVASTNRVYRTPGRKVHGLEIGRALNLT